MNSSLLNYGFRVFLIASILSSCSEESIDNRVLNSGTVRSADNFWSQKERDNVVTSLINLEPGRGLLLKAEASGKIGYSQTFNLDSGEYFLFAKYDANIVEGSFYINVVNSKSFEIRSINKVCERMLFSVAPEQTSNITIEFGFEADSKGEILLEKLFLFPIEYNYLDVQLSNSITQEISTQLNINLVQDSTLAQSVDLMAASINTAFLSKNEEERSIIVATLSQPMFSQIGTQYVKKYIVDKSIRDSYCQKSSLSLDELIRAYNIPTRQIHWQKKCSGFHQFLEYWNSFTNRWEIIDPYYGIRYVDDQGNYLGFESIEKLVRSNSFTKRNIKQVDIGHLTFNEDEILDGWREGGLAVYVTE